MADNIGLGNVLPSGPVQTVQQPQTSQGAPSQAVAINISTGTVISGFIVNRDASGNPILRTTSGDITFSTNFFLKIGSEVVIRVENSAGANIANVLSVDGQPPQIAESLSAFANEPDVVLSQQFTAATPGTALAAPTATLATQVDEPSLQLGSTITGTIISQAANILPESQPPIGSQVVFRIVSLNVPESTLPAEVVASAPATPNTAAQSNVSAPVSQANYATYARAAYVPPGTPASAAPVTPQTATTSATPANPSAQTVPPTITPQVSGNAIAVTNQPASAQPVTQSPAQTVIQNPSQTQISSPVLPTAVAAQPTNATTAPQVVTSPNIQENPVNTATVTNTIVQQPSVQQVGQPVTPPIANTATNPAPATIQVAPPTTNQAIVTTQPATASNIASLIPEPVEQQPTLPTSPVAAPIIKAPETVQPGQTITARIIGNEPTGEALVQTPAGVVRLQPGTVVPSGSSITLEVVQATPPTLATGTGIPIASYTTEPAPITQLAQQWTALQQIFNLLAGRPTNTGLDAQPPEEPISGATLESLTLPITSSTVTAGLMSFVSVMRSGDLSEWLGKSNIKWLEDQGHGDLLKRVDGELQSLARQFTTPTEHHWQPLFFPVSVEGNLQQVRMYVKRDRKQASAKQGPKNDDIRFVIEVDLTKLGELQMDGFVRHNENEMNFDMMIRSLTPLSKEIQNDILLIYTETGALTGYKGSLQFQSVKEFPVNPMKEIVAGMNTVSA